jgi:hypothetical protein
MTKRKHGLGKWYRVTELSTDVTGMTGMTELSTMWWNVLRNGWDGVGDGSTDFWV